MPEQRERSGPGALTPERFARLRALFEAALDRPAAERRVFVTGACAGDLELLSEVERMLAADDRFDVLLDGAGSLFVPEPGRVAAGTVLAGRYRILGLLGAGGMGEVYKAFDIILDQIVALKCLAPSHASEAALVRFRNEVRIARQVSHPNVCRVYDLGVVDGLHFLSMEYIDGEDLASLLRRIERLPQDKAIEFARKICAGLAAAHDRGVLHRDLKPANIMIDSRGQVRITDFGLAGLAAAISSNDLRSGTPAYMSPEQKAGREVTTRSDLYSLGLVLEEIFTGKSLKERRTSTSELVLLKDLDPAIEEIILRCLDEDPRRRPTSALSVAAALPGGDPIAAALAAGETPSPELIAASHEKKALGRRTALLCFVGVLLSLAIGLWLSETTGFLARAPLPFPPAALADRAQLLLRTIGYDDPPESTDYEFTCCDQQAIEHLYRYPAARRGEVLASHRPAIRYFQYHQHRSVSPLLSQPVLALESSEPGMIVERLDGIGRLMLLDVRPWPMPAAIAPLDWAVLFAAAGLDLSRFSATSPQTVPPMSSDARLAWSGSYADDRLEHVRVEAASWQGRPVLFEVQSFPVTTGARVEVGSAVSGPALRGILFASFIAAGLAAWRNVRRGRSDRQGAAVIAGVAVSMSFGAWTLTAVHSASGLEQSLSIAAAGWPVLIGASFWLVYVALEPSVRRHWPDALVSWTRLCHGQIRNPVVASHILAGIVAAEAFGLIVRPGLAVLSGGFSVLQVGFTTFAPLLAETILLLAAGLAFALIAALLRQRFRSRLQADCLVAALFAIPAGFESYGTGPLWIFVSCCLFGAASLVWMWLLRRFGFLTNLIVWVIQGMALAWPLTITGWFAGRSIAVHMIPVAMAAWALWVILSAPASLSRTADVQTAA